MKLDISTYEPFGLEAIETASEAIAETSQSQDQVVTATASGSNESSACSASEGKAYNICMVRGFFNITGVSCTCSQGGSAGAPIWECVGTATCKNRGLIASELGRQVAVDFDPRGPSRRLGWPERERVSEIRESRRHGRLLANAL